MLCCDVGPEWTSTSTWICSNSGCYYWLVIKYEYSKTLLTWTSGDRPGTSLLTEVRVIQKLKNQSYSTFNYAHYKCNVSTHMIHVNLNSYCLKVNYCSHFFSRLLVHVHVHN